MEHSVGRQVLIRCSRGFAGEGALNGSGLIENGDFRFFRSLYLPNCNINAARNTLDCDQSNYSSRIVFSHIPIEFGQTGVSAIRSADTENPILEPNTE